MVAASMAHIFRKSLRDRPPSRILSAMVCSRANLYPPHLWPLSTLYQLVEAANDEKNHVLPGKTPDISRNRHGKVISQQGKKRFQKGGRKNAGAQGASFSTATREENLSAARLLIFFTVLPSLR